MKIIFLLLVICALTSGYVGAGDLSIINVDLHNNARCDIAENTVEEIIARLNDRFGAKNVTKMDLPEGYEGKMVWIKALGWYGPSQIPVVYKSSDCYDADLLAILNRKGREFEAVRDQLEKEHTVTEGALRARRLERLTPFAQTTGQNGVTYFSHQICPANVDLGWKHGVMRGMNGLTFEGCWKRSRSKYYLDEIVEFCSLSKNQKGQLLVEKASCMIGSAKATFK